MNKFAPPTGDENAAPGTVPAKQTGAAQSVPGPNAAWSQGSGAPMNQPWAPTPAPVTQPGSQVTRSGYGTFYVVTNKGGRSLGRWFTWNIELAYTALFTWIGIEGGGWFYTSASITGGVVYLLLEVAEGGQSPWLTGVVSTPDGTILVRPGSTVMYLHILTALLANAAGVCFFYASLFGVDADIRSIADGNVLSTAVVAPYLTTKITGSQNREYIIVGQQCMDMWGGDGIHYSIPWSDRPRVIGQRDSGRGLLIGAGQNIECLVVFTTLHIRPSHMGSLLTYYQTTPGALDHLSTPEARDEVVRVPS